MNHVSANTANHHDAGKVHFLVQNLREIPEQERYSYSSSLGHLIPNIKRIFLK